MRTHTAFVASLALVCSVVPAAAQTSVAGAWKASFVTPDHTYPAHLQLTQDGEKLSGTVATEHGETKLTGTVQEKTVSFKFDAHDPGGSDRMLAVGVTGTMSPDGLTGNFTVDGNPTGTFSATRDTGGESSTGAPKPAASDANATATDVTGTWQLQVTTSTISASPTIRLEQNGDKITGQYQSQQYGQFPLTGTIKDGKIEIAFVMAIEGNNINVAYSGTVDNDGMKGTVNYGDLMDGTFTGTRKK